MNKFDDLKSQIENVITVLNEQINGKEAEIANRNGEIAEIENHIAEFNKTLESATKKRDKLSKIGNKSIIRYLLSVFVASIKDEIHDSTKKLNPALAKIAKLVMGLGAALLSFVLVIFTIADPILILGVIGLYSIFMLATFKNEISALTDLKEKYTVDSLNERIEAIELSIKINQESIKENKEKSTKLFAEIKGLQVEKAYYENALKNILAGKEEIIASRATEILNTAFDEAKYSDIIARVREKKKQGANNG